MIPNKKALILAGVGLLIAFLSYKYGKSTTNDPVSDVDLRIYGYILAGILLYIAFKKL